jgi:hypothetical protein
MFVEVIELPDHPWFLGCQFHPEFKSRPYDPHPIFKSFIGAAVDYRDQRLAKTVEEEAAEIVAGEVEADVEADVEEVAEAVEETMKEPMEA